MSVPLREAVLPGVSRSVSNHSSVFPSSPVAECVSIPKQRDPDVTRGIGTETADKDGTLTRPAKRRGASICLPLCVWLSGDRTIFVCEAGPVLTKAFSLASVVVQRISASISRQVEACCRVIRKRLNVGLVEDVPRRVWFFAGFLAMERFHQRHAYVE